MNIDIDRYWTLHYRITIIDTQQNCSVLETLPIDPPSTSEDMALRKNVYLPVGKAHTLYLQKKVLSGMRQLQNWIGVQNTFAQPV